MPVLQKSKPVTKPVEQQIATVENIKGLYSYSMEGTAIVLGEFENEQI